MAQVRVAVHGTDTMPSCKTTMHIEGSGTSIDGMELELAMSVAMRVRRSAGNKGIATVALTCLMARLR